MAVILADGAAGSPSVTFANDGSVGLYRASAGVMGISGVGSVQIASFSATGIGLQQDVAVADGKYIYQDDTGGIGNNSRARQYVDYTGGGSGYGGSWYLDTRTASNSWVNAIKVTDSQAVGIGVDPYASLVVGRTNAVLSGTGNLYGAYIYPTSSGTIYLDALTGGAGNASWQMRVYNNGSYYNSLSCSNTGPVNVTATGGGEQFRIVNTGGYAGIHYSDSTAYYIYQNSDLRELRMSSGSSTANGVHLTPGATAWTSYSDERLKREIVELSGCLDSLDGIRCVSYKLDGDLPEYPRKLGVIAQDLVGKYDEVIESGKRVDGDTEEYLGVRYTELIPVLIKALQEANERIRALESKIS